MQSIANIATMTQPVRFGPRATTLGFGAKSRQTLHAPVGSQTVIVAPTVDLISKEKMLALAAVWRADQPDVPGLLPRIPAYAQTLQEGLKDLREKHFRNCWVLLPSARGIYDDCKKETKLWGVNFPPEKITHRLLEGLAVEDTLTQVPRGLFAARPSSIGIKGRDMPRFLLPPVPLEASSTEKAMDEHLTPNSKIALKLLRLNFEQPGITKTQADLLYSIFGNTPPGTPGGPRRNAPPDKAFKEALKSLTCCGILIKTKSNGQAIYRLNPDHAEYAKIQAALLATKSP